MTILCQYLKSATSHLADWKQLPPTELLFVLPVPLEFHILMLNIIVLQLSNAVADIIMPQRPANIQILLTSVQFVADNAPHALASSATVNLTFNGEEEDIVNHKRRTPGMREREEYIRASCNINYNNNGYY